MSLVQLVQEDQRFRFGEAVQAVLFTNPIGKIQKWMIPADFRPYNENYYGEVVTIPAAAEFVAIFIEETPEGWHHVEGLAIKGVGPSLNWRRFSFFQAAPSQASQRCNGGRQFLEVEILP